MNRSAAEVLLRLGDDYLINGQRLSEWCGHAPMLEEDIALTNIALDSFGAAQLIYTMLISEGIHKGSADDLAFARSEREYLNCQLAEQPNGDFAHTILRQFIFDAFAFHFLSNLKQMNEPIVRSVAAKLLKEKTYHLRHSGEWVVRLGDGTDESRSRTENAFKSLWRFVPELFVDDDIILAANKETNFPLYSTLKSEFQETIATIYGRAKLEIPMMKNSGRTTGRRGIHTEYLGHLLSEMQILRRSYPGAAW